MSNKEITSSITTKMFRCRLHDEIFFQNTNHWGAIYSPCPKNEMRQICISDCRDSLPDGFEKPPEWTVKEIRGLSDKLIL